MKYRNLSLAKLQDILLSLFNQQTLEDSTVMVEMPEELYQSLQKDIRNNLLIPNVETSEYQEEFNRITLPGNIRLEIIVVDEHFKLSLI